MKHLIKRNQKGFTLIEMMIVMIIISILVLLVIPNASNVLTTANTKGCDALVKSLEAQAMTTKLETGSFPTSLSSDDQANISKVCNGQSGSYTEDGRVDLN